MKKILFPTDFSEVSNNAFVYALNLAKSFNAELIALHVYELPILHMGGLPANIKEVYDSIELENFDNFKVESALALSILSASRPSVFNLSDVRVESTTFSTLEMNSKLGLSSEMYSTLSNNNCNESTFGIYSKPS